MSEMPDLSVLFSMLANSNNNNNNSNDSNANKTEEMLATLINSSSNTSNDTSNNTTADNFMGNMPDMETIMKIMKVMQASNQDSPSKELLKSLKPFLKDSRKEKVDQYIKILGMTKVFEIFNELGGNQKWMT